MILKIITSLWFWQSSIVTIKDEPKLKQSIFKEKNFVSYLFLICKSILGLRCEWANALPLNLTVYSPFNLERKYGWLWIKEMVVS